MSGSTGKAAAGLERMLAPRSECGVSVSGAIILAPAARRPPPALRRHHRYRDPGGLRSLADAGRAQPGRFTAVRVQGCDDPPLWCGRAFSPAPAFDEAVTALFLGGVELRTVLRQLWSGVCEQLSPPPLAVATVLILIAVALLFTLEFLRWRNARMRVPADRQAVRGRRARPAVGAGRTEDAVKAVRKSFSRNSTSALGKCVPPGLLIMGSTLLMPVRKR